MRQIYLLPAITFLLFCVWGCSSVARNPVLNNASNNPQNEQEPGVLDSLPIIASDESSAIGLFGAFNLFIADDISSVELVPMRTTYIGESYIVSGIALFTLVPCTDCLKLESIAWDGNGNFVLGMKVKHPFQKGDPSRPPTAINRLDLDVFDLACLLHPIGLAAQTFSLASIYAGLMVNADGYTRELRNVINDTAAIPYKICYASQNNNRFEMGCDYKYFELVLAPSQATSFDLFLTMGSGSAAKKNKRLQPTYYVPEFNRKAAWKVVVTPPEGANEPARWNTWDNFDLTTEYQVTIDIYDWNHGATVASSYPDPANPDHISAPSDIALVTVEVPGMTSTPVQATTTDTSTNGWDNPITYVASFPNELGLQIGSYLSLVRVADSRIPGVPVIGGEMDTLVDCPDGINLNWYSMIEFATYQTFIATVVWGVLGDVDYIWGDGFGTSHRDEGRSVCVDSSGNVYVAGWTYGSLFSSNAGDNDIFLCKYNASGVPQWGRQIGTSFSDLVYEMDIDSFNNCYLVGSTWGNLYNTPNSGSPDIIVNKYDSNGDFQWGKQFRTDYHEEGTGIAVTSSGKVYCTGYTCGNLFNPIEGANDIFLMYLNSNDGSLQWGCNWGTSVVDMGFSCAIDNSGYAYISGITYESLYGTNQGDGDIVICKYSPSNTFEWGLQYGTTGYDGGSDIAVDSSDNVYTVGWTSGALFDPWLGGQDIFLTKHNSSGVLQWGHNWGTTAIELARSVSVDSSGYTCITGTSSGSFYSSNLGGYDIFFCGYSPSGTILFGRSYGSSSSDGGYGISSDSSGNFYVTGYVGDTLDMDPGPGIDTHVGLGSDDAFVSKFYFE